MTPPAKIRAAARERPIFSACVIAYISVGDAGILSPGLRLGKGSAGRHDTYSPRKELGGRPRCPTAISTVAVAAEFDAFDCVYSSADPRFHSQSSRVRDYNDRNLLVRAEHWKSFAPRSTRKTRTEGNDLRRSGIVKGGHGPVRQPGCRCPEAV